MPPLDQRFAELLRALRDRIPVHAPQWTEANQGDPGTTLAEVFAYLGEQVGSATTRLPAQARAELARMGARLLDLDRPGDTGASAASRAPDVRVNGERWTAIDDLATASADAAVFTLDPATGVVRFGDGTHGRRPADGATVTIQYRHGGGRTGNSPSAAPSAEAPASVPAPEPVPAPEETTMLERTNFFAGRLLSGDDLQREQDYVRRKLRRLNRAALGFGVVHGLTVAVTGAPAPSVRVAPGVAVDPAGELIEVPEVTQCPLPPNAGACVVLLRYAEQPVAPVPGTDGTPQPSRIAESYTIAIDAEPDSAAVVLARLACDAGVWTIITKPSTPSDSWDGDN